MCSKRKIFWALMIVFLALPTVLAVAQAIVIPPVNTTSNGQYGDPYAAWGYNKYEERHTGKDFGAGCGSPVIAPTNGTIYATYSNWFGYGQDIWIKVDGTNLYSFHAHLSQISVQKGQTVSQGQQIGLSGATGVVTGCTHHWGLSNKPPEDFGYFYEHADEQSSGRGWLNPDHLTDLLNDNDYQPSPTQSATVTKYQGFSSLPFLVDQRSQVADIMPATKDCHDININQIVIHQIAIETLPDPENMDGLRLATAFRNVKGRGHSGYQVTVGWNQTEYGYNETFWLMNLDCSAIGVNDNTNSRSVQIAYVDHPYGSPPKPMQYETLLVVTRSVMEEYSLSIDQVVGHKEICCHSDPAFSMDQFRQDLKGNIPQVFGGQGDFISVAEKLPFSLVTYQTPPEDPFVVEMIDQQGNLQEIVINLRSGETWLYAPEALEQAVEPTNLVAKWRNWMLAITLGISALVTLFGKREVRLMGLLSLLLCSLVLLGIIVLSKLNLGNPIEQFFNSGKHQAIPDTSTTTPSPLPMVWTKDDQPKNEPLSYQNTGELAPYFYQAPVGVVWGKKIVQWTSPYPNIDPNMAATIMTIESCGGESALSNTGACGLFQLWGRSGAACTDPEINAQEAMAQFQGNLQSAGSNWTAAMAGYNGGPMALKWFMGEITRNDYINFLQNHPSGKWLGQVAVSKADQVERYVYWAGMYTDQAIFGEFITKASGMCSDAAQHYGLTWPINP
jgi:hypothetical protein